MFKKALKIFGKIIAILILLFIILVLVLSIPSVQTKIGKYATDKINETYKTNISIGGVGLQFNGDVELLNVLIKDYKKDTLISIRELNTSVISYRNIYNNRLNFGDIHIEGLVFNLKTYTGEDDTNLDIFVAKLEQDNPTPSENPFLASSSDITIDEGVFNIIVEDKEDPNVLQISELNANATNFLINGPEVRARFNKLDFKTARGVVVTELMSDFEYTLDHMSFNSLSIETKESFLKGNLRFNYQREDLADFVNRVEVDASFKASEIQLSELNVFFDEFGTNQRAQLNVDLSGTLNNLNTTNLDVSTSRNTRVIGDIAFKNLFSKDEDDFQMIGKYDYLSSNYNDLTALLPGILGRVIPTFLDKVGNFKITGTSFISSSIIDADLKINTDIGYAESKLKLTEVANIDNASYVGNVLLQDFEIGKVIEDPLVGSTSLNLDVDGKSFKFEKIDTNVKGDVSYLEYNDYKYQGITVSGDIGNNVFNGILISKDENLQLNFNGLADRSKDVETYDFNAKVAYANLKALNFVSRDSISEFSGEVNMAVTGSDYDNLIGEINVKNTTYKNQDSEYEFQDFSIVSTFKNDIRTIAVNSPDIIEGQLQGVFKIEELLMLTENSIGSIYTNYSPHQVQPNQYVNFNFKIYNQIASIIDKELSLGPNTAISGRIETDEKGFELKFKTPSITYKEYFANNINLEVDNNNPVYNTFLELDSLNTGTYNIADLSLLNVTRRDTLLVKTEFKGGELSKDIFNLNLFYTINEDNKSVVGFRKSDFVFKDYEWFINFNKDSQNKVVFDRSLNNFEIDNIFVNQNNEEILLSGVLTDSSYKDLDLNFKNVELVKITPRIDSLALAGQVNGYLKLEQKNGVYLPRSDIEISDFNVNEFDLGNLKALITGDNSLTRYNVDVKLQNDNVRSLDATGVIDVRQSNSSVDLDVVFDDFLLEPLNPLGEGVISNIRGLVSGQANVSGNLKNPDIDGRLLLDRAGMTIPYLNVDYNFDFDSEVTLNEQRFVFNDVVLTDSEYFSKGNLNGFIEHNNFSNWSLGLELETDRLLVLNTEDNGEELYYGTGFISGSAQINGPTDELVISVDGTTAPGTVFNIPLNDTESFGDNSFITFLSPEEKAARARGEGNFQRKVKGLELDFDLDVNQNALIEIVIDKDTGSSIRGRGEGNLLFLINTNGTFNMWGDFAVFEGVYNFKYGAIVEKKFVLEQGGNIVWEGDPLGAIINLNATYTTTANPSVLLDTPINQSIPVELGITLTGQLERPDPTFDFDFPTVSSTVRSELQYRLSSVEERSNQALFLLATGGFASGIGDLNVTGTISERITGIFNSIIGSESGDLAVGLDLELAQNNPNFETNNRVGLTLQTKLSDKVLINGKVGVPFGTVATQSVIAGDVQIDILLNDEGTLRATIFNRENNIRNFGDRIGYTQGLGLSYNVEFDTFKELLQIIFSGKDKKEKQEEENKQNAEATEEENLPDFITMKKEKSKND
ncbi:translocation/assembly module TamB domain-containing protein [Winogradskyella sp. A3E31]|uniref:translocation/assembly module TamB domain-containing protein n=1 Tax=Winogradskyella sp. A3E31 TaxID=3349637 RepID=UPI00398AE7B1